VTPRIGHSSPAFCHDAPEATLAACAEAGFDVWEIVADGRHALPSASKAIRKALPSYDVKLQLHAPIGDVNLGSLNPRMWELSVTTVEQALRTCPALDIRRVTIHPGNHSPLSRGHYDKLHEATRKALLRLEPLGQELGLQLLLENMPASWAFETDSPQRLLDLVEGTSYGLTFDFGHAHVAKRFDEFLAIAKRFGNVHIHDNKGQTDEHLTLDEGTIDWRKAVSSIQAGGYQGTYVIESRSHPSGAKSQALLRTHLATLD
jgi:sugar phosphate isomerase/epimerase